MTLEKKVAYQQEYIKKLEAQIKELEEENASLNKELSIKEKFFGNKETTLENREANIEDAEKALAQMIGEVEDIKTKYKKALDDLGALRKNYESEMKSELKRLHQFK